MSSTHVVQQRASLWHHEPEPIRVRQNTGAKTWEINEDQRYVNKSKSVTMVQCGLEKLLTEELCYKYLSGAQPCLHLSALLL